MGKMPCFGGLNCSVDYECPDVEACSEAAFQEHGALPSCVVSTVQNRIQAERLEQALNTAFGWQKKAFSKEEYKPVKEHTPKDAVNAVKFSSLNDEEEEP